LHPRIPQSQLQFQRFCPSVTLCVPSLLRPAWLGSRKQELQPCPSFTDWNIHLPIQQTFVTCYAYATVKGNETPSPSCHGGNVNDIHRRWGQEAVGGSQRQWTGLEW
jgi:hypothetical protein